MPIQEVRPITKVKIKRADTANIKGRVANKVYRRLTVQCYEIPASFSLTRYRQALLIKSYKRQYERYV